MPRPRTIGQARNHRHCVAKRTERARLRPGARTFLLLLAGSLVFGPIRPASAQSGPFQTVSEGLNAGRFIFYPSVSIDFMHDSNVLYSSEDLPSANDLGSGVLLVKPRVMMDLPIGQSRIRWAYTGFYRTYTTNVLPVPNERSHFFDFEALLQVGRALHLAMREHYVRGIQEVQEFDPGGEVVVSHRPFTTNEPSLQADLDIGARQSLTYVQGHSRVHYDVVADIAIQGYTRDSMEGRYNYRLSTTDTLYGFGAIEDTEQDRASFLFQDVDSRGRTLGVGATRAFNQEVTTFARVGYQSLAFTGGSTGNFGGMVADVNASLQLSETSNLSVTVGRAPYQSFFLDQSYYLNDQIGVRFLHQIGSSLYWEIGGTFRNNSYPEEVDLSVRPNTPFTEDCDGDLILDSSDCNNNNLIDGLEKLFCVPQPGGPPECPSMGVKRNDRASLFEIGIGYRPRQRLGIFIGYNNDRRHSNIEQAIQGQFFDPFHYDVDRVFFRIEAGWR
jgi:putative beta-barrel porin BBP2